MTGTSSRSLIVASTGDFFAGCVARASLWLDGGPPDGLDGGLRQGVAASSAVRRSLDARSLTARNRKPGFDPPTP